MPGIDTAPALPACTGHGPAGWPVVAPLTARMRGALHAVLKSRSDQAASEARLMTRGAERC